MNCQTKRNIKTNPNIEHVFSQFFNTALGDLAKNVEQKVVTSQPLSNLKTLDDRFVLELGLPGIQKSEISISAHNNILNIKHVAPSEETIVDDEKKKFRLREFNYSGFSKSFKLPKSVDVTKISAAMENGILHITLMKKEEAIPAAPQTIEIV